MKEEETAQKAFDEASASKREEIDTATTTLETKETQLADNESPAERGSRGEGSWRGRESAVQSGRKWTTRLELQSRKVSAFLLQN